MNLSPLPAMRRSSSSRTARIRSPLLGGALLAALVAPPAALAAQDTEQAPPPDWHVRTDRPDQEASEIFFVDMPPGWHVTTGPAAIFWNPEMTASGSYTVEMDVYLFDPGRRREAFGLFLGGSDLDGEGQRYTYFLVRNGGEFIVKERAGTEAPTLVPWTGHDAVRSFADRKEGDVTVLNRLAVDVGEEEVRFLVNDQVVHSRPRGDLALDGVVGFRINHGLDVHVSRLEIKHGS